MVQVIKQEYYSIVYGITFVVTAIGIGVIVAANGSVILLENPSQIGGLQSVLKVYSSSSSDMTKSPKALILYQQPGIMDM